MVEAAVLAVLAVLLGSITLLEDEIDNDPLEAVEEKVVALDAAPVEPAAELDTVAEVELTEADGFSDEVVEADDAGTDTVAPPVSVEDDSADAVEVDDDIKVDAVALLMKVEVVEAEGEPDEDCAEADDTAVLDVVKLLSVIVLELSCVDLPEVDAAVVLEIGFVEGEEAVDPKNVERDCSLLVPAVLVLLLSDEDDCVSLGTRLLSVLLLDVELTVGETLAELVSELALLEVIDILGSPVEVLDTDSETVAVAEALSELLDGPLENDEGISVPELVTKSGIETELIVLAVVVPVPDGVDSEDPDIDEEMISVVCDEERLGVDRTDELGMNEEPVSLVEEESIPDVEDESEEDVPGVDVEELRSELVSDTCDDKAEDVDDSKLDVSGVETVEVEVISIEELDAVDVPPGDDATPELSDAVCVTVNMELSKLCDAESDEVNDSELDVSDVEAVGVGVTAAEELEVVAVPSGVEDPELPLAVSVSLDVKFSELKEIGIVESIEEVVLSKLSVPSKLLEVVIVMETLDRSLDGDMVESVELVNGLDWETSDVEGIFVDVDETESDDDSGVSVPESVSEDLLVVDSLAVVMIIVIVNLVESSIVAEL